MQIAAIRSLPQQVWTLGRAWPRTTAILAATLFLAGMIAMNLLLGVLGRESSLDMFVAWAFGPTSETGDSWAIMNTARDWMAAHADKSGLYKDIFFDQQIKFQYAPTSLMPLDGLAAVGIEPTTALLNTVNRVLILLTAAGSGVLAFLLMRRLAPGEDRDSRFARLAIGPLAFAAVILFYPVLKPYDLGQLQVWINLLFVGAAIGWLVNRRIVAGVLIGLICILKPQFGLFALWGLIRREWTFTLALVATAGAGLLLSVMLYGFGSHLGYLEVLSHLSRHGESYWPNQSFNGVFHRLLGNGDIVGFDPHGFPPFHPVVYIGTLITSIGLLALALWFRRGEGETARIADFLLAAVCFTVASPVAWEHHYGAVAPALVALFCIMATMQPSRMKLVWAGGIAASYFFAASYLPFFEHRTGIQTLLQAYLFFAALGAFAMLRSLAARRRPIAE